MPSVRAVAPRLREIRARRRERFVVRTAGSSGRPAEFFRTERDQSEVSALHGRIAEAFG